MSRQADEFTRFEHDGWERVARKYDSVWASLTKQYIPPLLDALEVAPGVSLLDLACGPGYLAAAANERGVQVTGLDFSRLMVQIAAEMFPDIRFIEGDAQELPFADASYKRVACNFGLLHLAHPERACAEVFRVLKPGSRFGFSVWAPPAKNPGAKIVQEAIEAHGNPGVDLPPGPPLYLYSDENECRQILEQIGYDGSSMSFQTHTAKWRIPTAEFFFRAERDAGVRTAGLLARQTPAQLAAIEQAVAAGVQRYATNDGFAIPMTAHVIAISKRRS